MGTIFCVHCKEPDRKMDILNVHMFRVTLTVHISHVFQSGKNKNRDLSFFPSFYLVFYYLFIFEFFFYILVVQKESDTSIGRLWLFVSGFSEAQSSYKKRKKKNRKSYMFSTVHASAHAHK